MGLAFVIPWYGIDIPGGAEAETRRTAEHLRRAGMPVEVLTTCVRDFRADWSVNYHKPGRYEENGVPVRRFPVRQRDQAAFDAVNNKLMRAVPVSAEDERVFVAEMVRSPALETYIVEHQLEYTFIFVPYMFGTTYWGIQACRGNALLMPCLHDEPYARMAVIRRMFAQVRRVLFLSEAEMALARALYDLTDDVCELVGGGVDTDWSGDADAFRRTHSLHKPFVLYAGRKDRGKNVDVLIQYFRRYRQAQGADVDLVLIGGGTLPAQVSADEGIHGLGVVQVQDKYNAYAAATLLCQPSVQESFSIVLMEGWVAGKPALVHSQCAVTKEHCIRSNGGLYFANYREFEACLSLLMTRPRLAARLGQNGRRYVLRNYHWDTIVARYRALFDEFTVG